jgi:hypothetical protein
MLVCMMVIVHTSTIHQPTFKMGFPAAYSTACHQVHEG